MDESEAAKRLQRAWLKLSEADQVALLLRIEAVLCCGSQTLPPCEQARRDPLATYHAEGQSSERLGYQTDRAARRPKRLQ